MDRPLLTGCLIFITGIILARLFTSWVTLWLVLAGASFFAALVSLFLRKKTEKENPEEKKAGEKIINEMFIVGKETEESKKPEENELGRWLTGFLLLCILFLGGLWYSLSRYPECFVSPETDGKQVYGEGTITTYPKENTFGVSFELSLDRMGQQRADRRPLNDHDGAKPVDKPLLKQVLIKGPPGLGRMLAPGDRVYFEGVIALPRQARNPGEFNYREYLANRGVFLIVNCQKGELRLLEKARGISALVAAGRKKVVQQLDFLLPQREKGLILGTLFGDTTLMEEEEWEAYQRTGVVHLFSVSGLHVGIVLGVVWFLLSFWKPNPFVRLCCGSVVLFGYVLMVGWNSPVIRASLMAALAMLALALGRKYDFYNSLGAAAWVVLLLSPGELFQAGFQFSFVTTAGMVYLTPWLLRKGCGKFLSPALAAHLVSAPISAYHFNQLSLIAPFVNLFAVAGGSVATVLSFMATLFSCFLPWLAAPLFVVAGALLYCLSELIIWCADFNGASIWVVGPSPLLICFLYMLLWFIPIYPYYRYILREIPFQIRVGLLSIIAALFLLACWPAPKGLEVVFLDVGQGDSIFIRTPGGKIVLVDGGGTPNSTYSVGKSILLPFLAHYGVNKIDYMIMSHNHEDHSEGLLEILPYFRVRTFWQPPAEKQNEMEEALRKRCAEKRIALRQLTAGQKLMLEPGVFLEVLHPDEKTLFTGNNRSLVLRLSYGRHSWLFTGDIEKEAVQKLLSQELSLRASVLKIPHHGSSSSYDPAFYQQVQPGAVVVSVGEKNLFGHPAPEVCAYFESRGIPVYLTKEKGAVMARSDGEKIAIRTFLP